MKLNLSARVFASSAFLICSVVPSLALAAAPSRALGVDTAQPVPTCGGGKDEKDEGEKDGKDEKDGKKEKGGETSRR